MKEKEKIYKDLKSILGPGKDYEYAKKHLVINPSVKRTLKQKKEESKILKCFINGLKKSTFSYKIKKGKNIIEICYLLDKAGCRRDFYYLLAINLGMFRFYKEIEGSGISLKGKDRIISRLESRVRVLAKAAYKKEYKWVDSILSGCLFREKNQKILDKNNNYGIV